MANDEVGDVLPAPSFKSTGEFTTDDEILAGYSPPPHQKGVTLKPGQGILPTGTVLAHDAASKKYVVYNNSEDATAGGTAAGVLRKAVDTGADSSADGKLGNIVFGGVLKNSKLSGLDSNAITDLNGRQDTVRDLFIF